MAPKKSAEEIAARRREKQPAQASSRRVQTLEWPRPAGQRFVLPAAFADKPPKKIAASAECLMRPYTSTWDAYDSFFYNAVLNLTLEPTRWADIDFMNHLKWFTYLQQLSESLGLGTMLFRQYEFYPELACQFLATCRVRYVPEDDRRACNGQLFFKIDGAPYFLTFHEICETFMFDPSGTDLTIPENDEACQSLWRELTNSNTYSTATSLQGEIRHPVLRMFLKLLDSTILCKMESGKMRKSNMLLLHYAIGHHFPYAADGCAQHRINFGAVFADLLESVKTRGLVAGSKTKTETIGSLITPLLQRVGIDLSGRDVDARDNLLRETNLKGQFLSGKWGAIRYSYTGLAGNKNFIRIPSFHCRVDSAEALRFLPTPEDHPVRDHVTVASLSSAPPSPATFGPFTLPPAGTYEDDPYRSWLTKTLGGIWERLRTIPTCSCTRPDAVVPPPPPHSRRARRGPDEVSDGRLSRSRSHTPPGL